MKEYANLSERLGDHFMAVDWVEAERKKLKEKGNVYLRNLWRR